jgi:hypothetical protein
LSESLLPAGRRGLKRLNNYTDEQQNKISEIHSSVQIPAYRQAGVIQISYDIVKADGGELKVETKKGEGTKYKMTINNKHHLSIIL